MTAPVNKVTDEELTTGGKLAELPRGRIYAPNLRDSSGRPVEVDPPEWHSAERVVGPDPDGSGRTVLLYAEGDPIPLDEAIRQGIADPEPAPEPEPKPKRRRSRSPA